MFSIFFENDLDCERENLIKGNSLLPGWKNLFSICRFFEKYVLMSSICTIKIRTISSRIIPEKVKFREPTSREKNQ